MRIKVDTGVCVGSGQCVLAEPAVFDQGEDGIVVLLSDQPEGEAATRARTAVEVCPARALSIVED